MIQVAALVEKPESTRELFEDGNMLYNAEKDCTYSSALPIHESEHAKHTITPKLRLKEADKKVSLSCIRKSFFPGSCRMSISTHITDAPNTHAGHYISFHS